MEEKARKAIEEKTKLRIEERFGKLKASILSEVERLQAKAGSGQSTGEESRHERELIKKLAKVEESIKKKSGI